MGVSNRQIDIAERMRMTASYHREQGDDRLADELEEGAREILNLRIRLRHAYDREQAQSVNGATVIPMVRPQPETRYPVRRRRWRFPRLFG